MIRQPLARPTTEPPRHQALWRTIWALLLLLHAPITIKVFAAAFSAGGDGATWSSVLLLAATNIFFIFEILFAWSLRVLTDRRSIVAFLVVIALLHVGVIDHAFPDLPVAADLRVWLAISAGGAALWRVLLLLPGVGRRLEAARLTDRRLIFARLAYAREAEPLRRACRSRVHARILPNRAPPFQA